MVEIVYTDIDAFVCAWLAPLMMRGHISPGTVVPKRIQDITPLDLRHTIQLHAFAGIGGWSHALRLAGWPDDRPVWTGSCPCQPFSVAGRQKQNKDERHLWPEWRRLIRECLPSTIFGEQVASPAGRTWLDTVSSDLEALGYAVGSADLCAASVGAPHMRQRLFFVAFAAGERRNGVDTLLRPTSERRVAETKVPEAPRSCEGGNAGGVSHMFGAPGSIGLVEYPNGVFGPQGVRPQAEVQYRHGSRDSCGELDFWGRCDWIDCTDGRRRPTEPGTLPLAYGVPGRVGRLRGYGNAIVPQVAAAFIRAAMSVGAGRGPHE